MTKPLPPENTPHDHQDGILACGCPETYPHWNHEDINLGGWLVHEQPSPMILNMPLAYDVYRQRQQTDIERLALKERWPGFSLTRSAMFRGSQVRLLEDQPCPARHVHRLPNPFRVYAAIHQGDVGGIRPLVRQVQTDLVQQGRMPKAIYLAYLTCPQCREARGGMRVMVLRHWIPSAKLKAKLEAKTALLKN